MEWITFSPEVKDATDIKSKTFVEQNILPLQADFVYEINFYWIAWKFLPPIKLSQ